MCKYEDSVQASCGSYTLTGIDSQVRQERFLNSMQFDDFIEIVIICLKFTNLYVALWSTFQAVKDAIVDKHNELRARVANGKEKLGVDGRQPKAANMRQLVWNDELAEIAQRYQNYFRTTNEDSYWSFYMNDF